MTPSKKQCYSCGTDECERQAALFYTYCTYKMSKEEVSGSLDLPLITEATNEFYRQVYGDPLLYPIFKGYNMVVLRRHVSYFIFQLTAFEEPLTQRQIDYLRRAHAQVVEQRGVTQRHFDMIASLLVSSLRTCGADGQQLLHLASKLRPVREIFPPYKAATQTTPARQLHKQDQPEQPSSNATVQQQQQQMQTQPKDPNNSSRTTVQSGQHTSQLAVQPDMQQCSQAASAHQHECCWCSSSAVQPSGVMQQQQHGAAQAPGAPAACKDGTPAQQQDLQKEQQAGQPENPRGLKQTQSWWKRLVTTIMSH